jgi:hypothetical protein
MPAGRRSAMGLEPTKWVVGDSSADNAVDAGDDAIDGQGGNDSLFGDDVRAQALQTVGTVGRQLSPEARVKETRVSSPRPTSG